MLITAFLVLSLLLDCFSSRSFTQEQVKSLLDYSKSQSREIRLTTSSSENAGDLALKFYGKTEFALLVLKWNRNLGQDPSQSIPQGSLVVLPHLVECVQFFSPSCISDSLEVLTNTTGLQVLSPSSRSLISDYLSISMNINAADLNYMKNNLITLKAANQLQIFSSGTTSTFLSGAMLTNILSNFAEEYTLQLDILSFSNTLIFQKNNLFGAESRESNFRYDNDIPIGTMKSFHFTNNNLNGSLVYSLIDEYEPTLFVVSWILSRAGNFLSIEFLSGSINNASQVSQTLITPETSSVQILVNASSYTRYRITAEIDNQRHCFASVLLSRDSSSYTNTSFSQATLTRAINEPKKISPDADLSLHVGLSFLKIANSEIIVSDLGNEVSFDWQFLKITNEVNLELYRIINKHTHQAIIANLKEMKIELGKPNLKDSSQVWELISVNFNAVTRPIFALRMKKFCWFADVNSYNLLGFARAYLITLEKCDYLDYRMHFKIETNL